jgi:hypothetical protein
LFATTYKEKQAHQREKADFIHHNNRDKIMHFIQLFSLIHRPRQGIYRYFISFFFVERYLYF